MNKEESIEVATAILLLFFVASLMFIKEKNFSMLRQIFIFSFVIILAQVLVKKVVAYLFDSNVEHRIWRVYYGPQDKKHIKKEIPIGIIVPLVFSLFSLGFLKIMAFLTYETRALKHKASKKSGLYTFVELTDWQNGLIGAAGIIIVFLISATSYLLGYEYLTKIASYYALINMLPISNLDGNQIFYGSKILWAVLTFISLIFSFYSFVLII